MNSNKDTSGIMGGGMASGGLDFSDLENKLNKVQNDE